MMHTRGTTATSIKNFRYAVRSGACVVAGFHLRSIADSGKVSEKTLTRLVRQLKSCKTASHFRRRRRR